MTVSRTLSNSERKAFLRRAITAGNYLPLACSIDELPEGFSGSLHDLESIKPQIPTMQKLLGALTGWALYDTFFILRSSASLGQVVVPLIYRGDPRSTEIFPHDRMRSVIAAVVSQALSIRESRQPIPDRDKITGWQRDVDCIGLRKTFVRNLAVLAARTPPTKFLLPDAFGELRPIDLPRAEDVQPPKNLKSPTPPHEAIVTDVLHGLGALALSSGSHLQVPPGQDISEFSRGDVIQFKIVGKPRVINLRLQRASGTIQIVRSSVLNQ